MRLVILFLSAVLLNISCAGGLTEKGGRVQNIQIAPSATLIRSSKYRQLDYTEGESSQFFLLGLIPVTEHLSIDYAMSEAVQKVQGGDSLADMQIWHEVHYFFPLGTVSVVKVGGYAVGLKDTQPLFDKGPDGKKAGKK